MNQSDFSRRRFLSVPAVAVGNRALLGAQSSSDTVGVAVIGLGNRGSYLLNFIIKMAGVKIVALCDIQPETLGKAMDAARAAGQTPEGASDYRKILDRRDVDAVLVVTPVNLHKEMALAVLEAGKHLYCEKPMGLTPEDCRAVANAARAAKGIFQAGFQLRHDPNRAAAMQFLKSGGMGKVLFLEAHRHTADLPREIPWYFNREISGDSIVEQACHIIDLMVWAAGSHPLRAYGTGGINLFKNDPPGRTTMDNYTVTYEFPDDVRFSFTHLYFDPPGFSGIKERVFCAEGSIDLATAAWVPRLKRGEVKLPVPEAGPGDRATPSSLAAFLDNVRGKKTPMSNADSARISNLAAMMGRKSIYERRMVTWDEVDV